jgi:S-adenosylmethionine hydrolase
MIATVALLSDFGADSFYIGVMKSAVLSVNPDARLVDITHSIPAHNISAASYVLTSVLPFFAPETVFLAVVDPGVGSSRAALLARCGRAWIVAPDNGLAAEAIARWGGGGFLAIDPARVAGPLGSLGATFHGRDVFAVAAGRVAAGEEPDTLGTPLGGVVPLVGAPGLEQGPAHVRGYGRFIDSFGNILSNIPAAALGRLAPGPRGVRATVNGRDAGVVRNHYAQGACGDLVVLVNSWGMVEVAVVEGSAARALAVADPEGVTIELSAAQ